MTPKSTQIIPSEQAVVNFIATTVHQNALAKGFHGVTNDDEHFIDSQTNNLHDEISELHEAWRNGHWDDPCDKSAKMIEMGLPSLTCAEEEYADIIIRVLDQCARLNIDIGRAVAVKHEFNRSRPFLHGGKLS